MADSNTLFLLVSYTVFVSVLQNILFTEATILIYICSVKEDDTKPDHHALAHHLNTASLLFKFLPITAKSFPRMVCFFISSL